jgi:hypothetical protein
VADGSVRVLVLVSELAAGEVLAAPVEVAARVVDCLDGAVGRPRRIQQAEDDAP